MSKNYAALAQQIVAAIGGVDNVAAVTHCMTRLRFVVKDDEQVDSSTLKGLAGVLGVVRSDNQCQVIIGNTVSQAYREVVNLLPGDLRPAEPQGKAPLTLKRIGAGILDALIGTMSPLIPAIIGGSMVKLLAMILEMSGAVAGIAGLASHSMAAPGLFTSVQFFDPANPMTIVWVFGVMALSVVLSFALTLILGFEDIPVEQAAADARARQARAQASHA